MREAKGYWLLTIEEDFSAAHALRNLGGRCEDMHGHNYLVRARVSGDALDTKAGIVLDFGILRTELKAVLKELDHRNLNEVPPFDKINPSSEHLAMYVFRALQARLSGVKAILTSIEVAEKPGQSATYSEDG